MIKKRGFETFLVSILLVGTVFGGVVYGSVNEDPSRDCQCIKFDCDKDCDIDVFDFDAFGQAWGSLIGSPQYCECCDTDDDGDVDIMDFAAFAQHWGATNLCPGCTNCTAPPWEPW